MFNRTTVYILIAALATACALWAVPRWLLPRPAPQLALQTVQLFDHPRALAPFSLQQSDRTQLVPGELKGHWTVVFLGFTHCPDLCPTTLAQLAQAQKHWDDLPESTRPRVLFVSVDPDRDTPDAVGEYAHGFDRETLAATADNATLESFARSLSLVFMKVPAPAGAPTDQYEVDHSATLAVLDPQARMAGVIQPPLVPGAIASDLRALTSAASH
jgi:protein SCO1/2